MLKAKTFLSLDLGAGTLKVAEFAQSSAGVLVLQKFGVKSLGLQGSQDAARERVVVKALQELVAERGFSSKQMNVCAPGFHVFSKFVKLPPVDTSKVTQIIQYEAQQNVPFPLEEVVWDYQILGSNAAGELEVLLVAVKADIVEGMFRTAQTCGLRIGLVDVSPASICNAFRYNYSDVEGCSMMLDIGAKTSNVYFFEKGKFYARSINIGANSITQDFATEAKLPFAEAEKFKIAEGFVSLGGAYEEPENPKQAAVSKIARQVLTRLHIQVNQTVQFYRGQQGGSAPQRIYLSGGASIMAYTTQFFAEKFNVPIEYFNPFRNVEIDPSVSLEELAVVAHSFGEVVGLGLRNVAQCPVEMNLIPKSLLKKQQLNQKKPYFIATVFSLIAFVFAYGWFYGNVAAVTQAALDGINLKVQPLQSTEQRLQSEEQGVTKAKNEMEQLSIWLQDRFYWQEIFSELRALLMATEAISKQKWGRDAGVWIERFGAEGEEPAQATTEEENSGVTPFRFDRAMMMRYGLIPRGLPPGAEGAAEDPAAATDPAADPAAGGEAKPKAKKDDQGTMKMTCRGINLTSRNPAANTELAFALEKLLKESPLFDPAETKLSGQLEAVDAAADTFTFQVTLKLKRVIKL